MIDQVTAAVNLRCDLSGEDRRKALARWEREGKLRVYTVLGDWDQNHRRTKTRHIDIWQNNAITMKFTYDARQPYPDELTFAKIALAVMATT